MLTGTEVSRSDNRDRTVATAALTPSADGTFYLSADPWDRDARGTYEVSLFQEIANTFDTTENLKFGISEIGQYNYSTDVDMFRATFTEGIQYSVFLGGSSEPDSVDRALATIYDAQGNVVATGNSFSSLRLDFTPDTSGSYFVSVGSDTSFGRSGSYVLRVEAGNLKSTEFDDVISGGPAAELISGGGGDDRLSGLGGNDIVDGGTGVDTGAYSGKQANYTLTLTRSGATITDRRADGNGTDTLIDMEFLDFDTNFFGEAFDLQVFGGAANLSEDDFGSFIELYIAYFNRAPDAVGLYFWGTAFANGLSLEEIASFFIDQDETRATYPDGQSNLQFATAVYNNVLGRTPDQSGLDFWVGQLDGGGVGRDAFILEVLRGAKADPDPGASQSFIDQQIEDRQYLSDKTDIGAYFSVIKGMSDTGNASAAMDLFTGSAQSIFSTVAQIDQFYAAAQDADAGEFLMPMVGVLDDPFSI